MKHLKRFLLALDKFMIKMNLRQAGLKNSVCGPFTKKKKKEKKKRKRKNTII